MGKITWAFLPLCCLLPSEEEAFIFQKCDTQACLRAWPGELSPFPSDCQKQQQFGVCIMTHGALSTLCSESCHLLLDLRAALGNQPSCLAFTSRLGNCLDFSQIVILFLSQGSLSRESLSFPLEASSSVFSLKRRDFPSNEDLKYLRF